MIKTGEASGPVKDRRIEEVIAEFTLAREEILYVLDSPNDIAAYRQCRIKTVAAAWAPTDDVAVLQSMHPDCLFTSIPRFFAFLKTLYGD